MAEHQEQASIATVKEGFIGRHLTFVPLGGITVGPDDLQVTVFELNYTPPQTESGRRLGRR